MPLLKSDCQRNSKKGIQEIDSICIVIYHGMDYPPPILNPKYPEESNDDFAARDIRHKEKLDSIIGKINPKTEMSWFSEKILDEDGKFNPTIIWESKRCLNKKESNKVIRILHGLENNNSNSPAKCFFPRHGILTFKKGKIVSNYSICFQCFRTKMNDEKYLLDIDYNLLEEIFLENKIPLFENEEEFNKYIKVHKNN